MRKLFKKYQAIIAYIFFGGLTTLVNISVFFILQNYLGWNYQLANVIAWFLSVLFAYVTNKFWVFASKYTNIHNLAIEIIQFFGFRAFTLLIDFAILWLGISVLGLNALLVKIIDNLIVIVFNYFFSKMYIFRKNKM